MLREAPWDWFRDVYSGKKHERAHQLCLHAVNFTEHSRALAQEQPGRGAGKSSARSLQVAEPWGASCCLALY